MMKLGCVFSDLKHIHNPLLTGYDPEDDYDIHCDYNDHDFFYDYIHLINVFF